MDVTYNFQQHRKNTLSASWVSPVKSTTAEIVSDTSQGLQRGTSETDGSIGHNSSPTFNSDTTVYSQANTRAMYTRRRSASQDAFRPHKKQKQNLFHELQK
eukprot:TRINITY_DN13150_c0_g1_i1.p1 TRINITY_DN13150_c0_g1~~TRINITY_DN13150_c0_g1_i1.p1  ORF type:complete len:101 (+),score=8.55 TRINITY_DN13150_c0_g1_i1:99-401(+)